MSDNCLMNNYWLEILNQVKTVGFYQPESYCILTSSFCCGIYVFDFSIGQNICPLSPTEKLSLPPSMILRRRASSAFEPYTSDASIK